jgi:hypothetical protein
VPIKKFKMQMKQYVQALQKLGSSLKGVGKAEIRGGLVSVGQGSGLIGKGCETAIFSS